MKIFTLIILLISFTFTLNSNAFAQYEQGKIIIKFEKESELFYTWNNNNNSGSIEILESTLGINISSSYLPKDLLKSLRNSEGRAMRKSSFSTFENLSRIALVNYTYDINPLEAARKISSIPGIEYAEAVSQNQITAVPNDPDYIRQYYHQRVKAADAWDYIEDGDTVLIAIVDTGIDFTHPELASQKYINPGEDGTDNDGNDKRTNGIDDDNNGFIDDWQGWDFGNTDIPGGDNEPYPGNQHGTHVAGISAAVSNNNIGIAGISKNAKLLAVKIGPDNPLSINVINSYQGIIYAALMGADVINCSWGSTNRSDADKEIISAAVSLGSIIIGAAGNSGQFEAFYPGSFEGVLSVAASDEFDNKSFFSNYHTTVGISAPGVNIWSTIPDSSYAEMDGTSMAAPIVSGVAALTKLKYPELSSRQIIEHIKATSDKMKDANGFFRNKIGKGRVNALNAVSSGIAKSVILDSYRIVDENGDGILDDKEYVEIYISVLNVLAPIKSMLINASSNSEFKPDFINNIFEIDSLGTGDKYELTFPITFTIPENMPLDYNMELELKFSDSSNYEDYYYIYLIIKPSYRTMSGNNLSVTFNSIGNIAYNDYPANSQGEGFRYKDKTNILYEGSLMIGTAWNRISNVARGVIQEQKDKSFHARNIFLIDSLGTTSKLEGTAAYYDDKDSLEAGVEILQTVYQFDEPGAEGFIIVCYDIINKTDAFFDSLYTGLYFDWDIGPSGANNKVFFENNETFGFIKNVYADSLPMAGTLLLSNQNLNFFAMDNNGTSEDNPGVWNGFSRKEKWFTMTNGIKRKESSIIDASIVIGAGPIGLRPGDTTRVAFSLLSAMTIDELRNAASKSREIARREHIADGNFSSIPGIDSIHVVYPNPIRDGNLNIEFTISNSTRVDLLVYDSSGKLVYKILDNAELRPGFHLRRFDTFGLSQGRYFVWLKTGEGTFAEPFNIIK